jgi:hypothetical protein
MRVSKNHLQSRLCVSVTQQSVKYIRFATDPLMGSIRKHDHIKVSWYTLQRRLHLWF